MHNKVVVDQAQWLSYNGRGFTRALILCLKTCMLFIHKMQDMIKMFGIALNPSGGAYLLHAVAHTCYFLKDHVYNIHHWSDDIANPPHFMHMVGLEPRFHQCMTHILPIYLWVE